MKYVLVFTLIFIAFLQSCRKKEDDLLEGAKLVNVLDPDTNVKLFTIKDIAVTANPPNTIFRFETHSNLLNAGSNITNVLVFRNSEFRFRLDPGNDSIFADYDLVRGRTYSYQFTFLNTNKDTAKLSEKYWVTVP